MTILKKVGGPIMISKTLLKLGVWRFQSPVIQLVEIEICNFDLFQSSLFSYEYEEGKFNMYSPCFDYEH